MNPLDPRLIKGHALYDSLLDAPFYVLVKRLGVDSATGRPLQATPKFHSSYGSEGEAKLMADVLNQGAQRRITAEARGESHKYQYIVVSQVGAEV